MRNCIDCGESFPPESPGNRLRCEECKRVHRNQLRRQLRYFNAFGAVKICCDCGADISGTRGRKVRCDGCQHKLEMKRKRDKRKGKWDATEHLCKKCGRDISDRTHNATVCWACRRKKQAKTVKAYQKKNKKKVDLIKKKYYDNNKEKTQKSSKNYQQRQRKLKKKILEMSLPDKEPNCSMWVEWDNIPRCEGINLSTQFRNTFGDRCKLRASYRLKDKYDGTERYLCPFHLKTIGSLKWYNIEVLEHQTIIRRETRLKWKKIQKKEIDKKKKIRNARAKKKKRKKKRRPETPYNAHYPLTGSFIPDGVTYPSENSG